MPRPKGLRHKWGAAAKSACQRPGCKWVRDRGYIPARYFKDDSLGTTEAPVCEGQRPGIRFKDDICGYCSANLEIGEVHSMNCPTRLPSLQSFQAEGGMTGQRPNGAITPTAKFTTTGYQWSCLEPSPRPGSSVHDLNCDGSNGGIGDTDFRRIWKEARVHKDENPTHKVVVERMQRSVLQSVEEASQ